MTRKKTILIAVLIVTIAGVIGWSKATQNQAKQTIESNEETRQAQLRTAKLESELSIADQFARQCVADTLNDHDRMLLNLARGFESDIQLADMFSFFASAKTTLTNFTLNPRYASDPNTADAFYRLGQMRLLMGDNLGAQKALDQAITLSRSAGNWSLHATAINTRGCLMATWGKSPEAQSDFDTARKLHGDHDLHPRIGAIAMRNLSILQMLKGKPGHALLQNALTLLEELPENNRTIVDVELAIDMRAAYCKALFNDSQFESTRRHASRLHQELDRLLLQTRNFGKRQAHRSRYEAGLQHAKQMEAIAQNASTSRTDASPSRSEENWIWHPLVRLETEMVPIDIATRGIMTAEFDHQSGIVIGWSPMDWTSDLVSDVVRATAKRCNVVVVADTQDSLEQAQQQLMASKTPIEHVRFSVINFESPWLRDCGPIVCQTRSGNPIWFDPMQTRPDETSIRPHCDRLPRVLGDANRLQVCKTPIQIEGGILVSNGRGLTVTSHAIKHVNREYGFSEEVVGRELQRITGADQLVFVDSLYMEPTAHVDMYLTFTDPHTVVVGQYLDPQNPNAEILDGVAKQLADITFDGKPLRVHRIPMPPQERTLFPSYTNVVFANGVLLVPSYQKHRHLEPQVQDVYQRLLPDWKITFVDCSRVMELGGALHCLIANLGNTPMQAIRGIQLDL